MADTKPTAKHENKVNVPEQAYQNPMQVLTDKQLSWDEKMTALKNWEMDERAALVADDENMTAQKPMTEQPPPEEMLKTILAAERRLEEAPPSRDAHDKTERECRLLTALIAMNIDACIFYRNAAVRAEHSELETKYHALEKIHSLVIADLSIALQKKGRAMTEAEPLYMSHYGVFRDLCAIPYTSENMPPAQVIEDAENACCQALQQGVDDENISGSSRFHLSCGVQFLQKRHEHLKALGTFSKAM